MKRLPNRPLRFILIVGVLEFGGLSALILIARELLTTPFELRRAIAHLALYLVAGAIGGLLWGSVMWVFFRFANHLLRRFLPGFR